MFTVSSGSYSCYFGLLRMGRCLRRLLHRHMHGPAVVGLEASSVHALPTNSCLPSAVTLQSRGERVHALATPLQRLHRSCCASQQEQASLGQQHLQRQPGPAPELSLGRRAAAAASSAMETQLLVVNSASAGCSPALPVISHVP